MRDTIDEVGDEAVESGDPGKNPPGCCCGDVDSDAKSEEEAVRLAPRKLFFLLGVSPTAVVADWNNPSPGRLLTVLLLLLPALLISVPVAELRSPCCWWCGTRGPWNPCCISKKTEERRRKMPLAFVLDLLSFLSGRTTTTGMGE